MVWEYFLQSMNEDFDLKWIYLWNSIFLCYLRVFISLKEKLQEISWRMGLNMLI